MSISLNYIAILLIPEEETCHPVSQGYYYFGRYVCPHAGTRNMRWEYFTIQVVLGQICFNAAACVSTLAMYLFTCIHSHVFCMPACPTVGDSAEEMQAADGQNWVGLRLVWLTAVLQVLLLMVFFFYEGQQ